MLKTSSFASTFLQHFLLMYPSLSTNYPFPATKFDWMASTWQDSTAAWDNFSSFLESRGVSVFGTEAYKTPSFPPVVPALDPFFPTRDEDLVYRQVRTQGRVKEFQPPVCHSYVQHHC